MLKEIRVVLNKQDTGDVTPEELDEAPDGFFEKISLVDVYEVSDNQEVLKLAQQKVRTGGKLFISGVDGNDLARQIYLGDISLETASNNIFQHVKRLTSALELCDKISSEDKWSITFTAVDNGRYSIEAIKNG